VAVRILEITSAPEVNGAVIHCLRLSRELARRGHEVFVACRPGAWIERQLAGGPIEVIRSDLHRWPLDELSRMASIVRKKNVEIIHTHMSRAHFFGVLLRWFAGVPCVATAHNRLLQLHWMFNDHVIAVSEATRRFQHRVNLVRNSRLTTIPNFIDDRSVPSLTPARRAAVRAQIGADEASLLLGVVGAIIPRKGQIYLVRALPKILAACPKARLVLVGTTEFTSDYVSQVRDEADRLGVASHIVWTGHRDDAAEIMSALDLFVLPSLEESLPLTILEAMATGLPIVATAVSGVPEVVRPNETGILVPPRDCNALADAILALLADPERRRQFGQAGQRLVKTHHSIGTQVTAIEQVLAAVAGHRRAA
jgi:glycosyltransferase involved in cell wall biosynthesis